MKKLLTLIFQPLKYLASRSFAEKVSIYFTKHRWMVYLVSLLITLLIVFFSYILPEL